MITWLIGENSFEVRETLKEIETAFDGTAEKVDGAELVLSHLPDLLMGVSLFAPNRLVIIRDLTSNSSLFEKVSDWLPRVNDDIHVVFVDTKPDKRTSSYKALKAAAQVKEFPVWTERDTTKAEQWVSERAKGKGVSLDQKTAGHLVRRVGVDQWQLANAIEMVALLDEVTLDAINAIIPANLQENIFQLFETALEGKASAVRHQIEVLALQEDPYGLFALLSSQVLTLAAVTYADDTNTPTKDLSIHPFVASKLARHGAKLGKARVGYIVEAFAKTDAGMKRSKAEPWLMVERVLLEVTRVAT